MKFGYDKTNWPIVTLTAEGSPENDEQISRFFDGWTNLYSTSIETKTRFKFFIDIRELTSVDMKYLIMISKYLVKMKKVTESWMDRTGILVSSNIIKQLLDFVFTIYKPVRPFKIFNDPVEGLTWVINSDTIDTIDEGYKTDESGDESNDESNDKKIN